MKIRLICIGKMKNTSLRALATDYGSRVSRFAPLEIVELRDGQAADPVSRLAEEAKAITAVLAGGKDPGKGFKGFGPNTVLLDERGEALDTPGFSRFLDKAAHKGPTLDIILGSSHGIDPDFKKLVPKHVRLSSMTLTHEWARTLLLEQVYRAFCLEKGFPYHH
jgi:23S rRNA (pseudouridine1915-N3)-methyltransferase